tara:strand:+ start:291 stop:641 length:351 start_codon:yes stop_codon:yes gene_type:complete
MNVEELRDYCISKPCVTESFPFDQTTLVFKVGQKVFALTSLERQPTAVNLKCDPEKALDLREQYPSILPGYHMNKRHWNTIQFIVLPNDLVKQLIDYSYELVFQKMSSKARTQLGL